jgi:hypothetical protein
MLSTGVAILGLLAGAVTGSHMPPAQHETVRQAITEVAKSGRCATLVESPDERVAPPGSLPPGPPPLLSFRYYEGKAHHRLGNSELMLDDAGH